MIDGHLHRCGPDSIRSLIALARAVGGSWVVFPVPGMWAYVWFKFACPGLWGLFFLVDYVGCARMWVIGICLSCVFCFGLMPLFHCFWGGAVRFSFFWAPFLASCVFFLLGFALLVINSYLSKKKKNRGLGCW